MSTAKAAERRTSSELPLVLLAVAGHPLREFRESLLGRLDEAIDAMEPNDPRPPYTRRELRTFFYKQHRRRIGGVALSLPVRELTARLALLAFTKPTDDRQCRLFVGEDDSALRQLGYLVEPDLSVIDVRRSSLTRHRMKRRQAESRFLVGLFQRRLREVREGCSPVKAFCRVEGRLVLEFRGQLPWDTASVTRGAWNLPLRRTSPYPGWELESDAQLLRLWPDSPEGVLRLTAAMAAGKTLCVSGPGGQRSGAIVVHLRDFDGDEAELPVRSTRSQGEPWLARVPGPPLILTADDRLALARWAYPLREWLTPEFTERLF